MTCFSEVDGLLDDPKLRMLMMYLLAQVLGISVGVYLIQMSAVSPVFSEMKVEPMGENNPLNSLLFVVYVLVGSLLLLILLKFYRGIMLYRLMEFFVIFFASNIVFFVLFYIVLNEDYAVLLALASSFLLALGKQIKPELRNVAAIVSSAGVGAVFGFSLNFLPSIVFAILLSVYDYIAVFKTRHMITFAKEFSTKQLAFTLVSKKPEKKTEEERKTEVRYIPGRERRLELGTGDVVVPMMVAVSSYYPFGWCGPVVIVLSASVSLWMLMCYVSRKGKILPALPFLTSGMLVGTSVLWLSTIL